MEAESQESRDANPNIVREGEVVIPREFFAILFSTIDPLKASAYLTPQHVRFNYSTADTEEATQPKDERIVLIPYSEAPGSMPPPLSLYPPVQPVNYQGVSGMSPAVPSVRLNAPLQPVLMAPVNPVFVPFETVRSQDVIRKLEFNPEIVRTEKMGTSFLSRLLPHWCVCCSCVLCG